MRFKIHLISISFILLGFPVIAQKKKLEHKDSLNPVIAQKKKLEHKDSSNPVIAQKFSGLQNKKLEHIDSLNPFIKSYRQIFQSYNNEEGLLKIQNSLGSIDSVVITYDASRLLIGKIYYTNFVGGSFTVGDISMPDSKSELEDIMKSAKGINNAVQFSQIDKKSPAEFRIEMPPDFPIDSSFESQYLGIFVGNNIQFNQEFFILNKKWKNNLAQKDIILKALLTPIGVAANIPATKPPQDKLPLPSKLKFEAGSIYKPPANIIIKKNLDRLRTGGGNSFAEVIRLNSSDNISGTWITMDPNPKTETPVKFIISENKTIQVFGSCLPENCDWGITQLTDKGENNFEALYPPDPRTGNLGLRSHFAIHVNGSQMKITFSMRPKINPNNIYGTSVTLNFMKKIATVPPSLRREEEQVQQTDNKKPEGPDNIKICLLDDVYSQIEITPRDLCNLNVCVFQDKNPASGFWYILPADYHLKWETQNNPEKGFKFNVIYGSMRNTEGGQPASNAPVRMEATLTAGISNLEKNFIKTLLRDKNKYVQSIVLFPLKQKPDFKFEKSLGQYHIPPNNIDIIASSNMEDDIKISWQTDADTKEFIQSSILSGGGITAAVEVKPDAENIPDQQFPALINFADKRILGKIILDPNKWRSDLWRNNTPYPLKLNYLHILIKPIDKSPIVYSWKLNSSTNSESSNDLILLPQSRISLDPELLLTTQKIPTWLDKEESVFIWIDYDVVECKQCDQKIMDNVTGGTGPDGKSQQIKFTIPPALFDTLNASYFLITVRSKQVDPRGDEVKELPEIKIIKEKWESMAGPLFIPTGGTTEFEYKITVATSDDFYSSNGWIKANGNEVLLGKTKLKEIFRGIIPGFN